ncbi:MAG TPA: hypothetical protein VI796_06110 [Candidatus Thermoplasmatota archaeon]|nr:hypothetical protein [Candidatus Thermoplasmatota archaeon]
MRRSTLGLLLLAVCLASMLSAGAQAPPSPEPSVAISAADTEVSVSVESPTTVDLTVENTTPGTGTPLDQPRTILLEVSGASEGWTAHVDPVRLRLAAGATATATLTISVATDAGASDATVTVVAKMLPLGVDAIPGVGPAVDPETTASVEVQAHRDDSLTRDILETIGPWIYVLFLALLAAILITVKLVVGNRRTAVALSAEAADVTVPAGGRGTLTLTVENLTKAEDTVVFQVSAVATGWAAFLPVPELQLAPQAREEIALTVIAAKDLHPGDSQSILVSATSAQAPKRPAVVTVDATVGGRKGK